jgi:hypothetical protein
MNYNDVVNRFKEIVEDHRMLVDFGYGQISDIKTRSEGMGELEGADYPYLFLNPGVHQRTESQITYNFNMIIMDMAREEEGEEYQNFLNIQSNCIQYCDDVLARLRYHYKDKPEILFTVGYTPFYERFQDDLAGATATISIVVPQNINECIAPFEGDTPTPPPTGDLVLDLYKTNLQAINPETGNVSLIFDVENVDTYGGWATNLYRLNTGQPAGTWTIIMNGTIKRTTDTQDFPTSFNLVTSGAARYIDPDISNWPIDPALGVDVPFTLQWTGVYFDASDSLYTFQARNEPPNEDAFEILGGATITGYFIPAV